MTAQRAAYTDRSSLPTSFPTHAHDPKFWEQLGRTIATFGFLEKILCKAIFGLTATTSYSESEIQVAYSEWAKKLEKALTDSLAQLADSFGDALRNHPISAVQGEAADSWVERIKKAARVRNMLCHASWTPPDVEGRTLPFFVNRQLGVLESKVDIAFLRQTQDEVVEIICGVIDSLTLRGYLFPGSKGPGMPIR